MEETTHFEPYNKRIKSEYFTFDANGNPIKTQTDHGNDGTIDYVSTCEYTYNSNGDKTIERYEGEPWKWINYYTYDSYGNRTKREVDNKIDGSIDRTDVFIYKKKDEINS